MNDDRDPAGMGRPAPDDRTRHFTAARVVLSDGTAIRVTAHCVDRFWARAAVAAVRFADARDRLVLLAEVTGEFSAAPDWAMLRESRWVTLGPDVGLVVDDRLVARTCLVRGDLPETERARRNARRKAQHAQQSRRRRDRRKTPRPRPETD